MHIEVLVEDASGKALLEALMPKLLGEPGHFHTWRIIGYKGIGKIPRGLSPQTDASKRILLDQLGRLLKGYGKTPGIDAVVVVLDTDDRDCKLFLAELKALVAESDAPPNTLIRLAIEEIEAWYFGDRKALLRAFPKAKLGILDRYVQDSPCSTWELLADALHPGGVDAIRKAGWPVPGKLKNDWALRIGPEMDPECNVSPSFGKLRDGIRRLVRS